MISDLSDDSILYVAMVSDKGLVIVQSSCGRLKGRPFTGYGNGNDNGNGFGSTGRRRLLTQQSKVYQLPRQIPESPSTVQ
jgi:hypothetical protein